MKPIVLTTLLAGVVLLHAHPASAQPPAAELRPAAAAPESPAAAFQRLLAHAPTPAQAPAGAPADPLTRAFNHALWTTPGPAVAYATAAPQANGGKP